MYLVVRMTNPNDFFKSLLLLAPAQEEYGKLPSVKNFIVA